VVAHAELVALKILDSGHSPKQFWYATPELATFVVYDVAMRIAQIAPLYESVPPRYYGGTERVVSYLTEELVRAGHDVTLFASGDSVTSAHLVKCSRQSLRLDKESIDPLAHHVLLVERAHQCSHEFDVMHFHINYLHFPRSRLSSVPHLTTLHGRLDVPDLVALYEEFSDMPLVSISHAQRNPLPRANFVGTVYHGLPSDLYHLERSPGEYLAFLGRIAPEKGVERAIRIALDVGMRLKIAAKIESPEYFEQTLKPLLNHPLIDYIGEIGELEKQDLLGSASCLLAPIDWPEPFGLVMIEALACGTPSIAYRLGAVPEVLNDGETGFVVDSIEEAVEAISRIPELSRERCRQVFEERFTATRMADQYVEIYERLAAGAVPSGSEEWRT
jgi:glycosyltransferase involved in cell wall biosynthesis